MRNTNKSESTPVARPELKLNEFSLSILNQFYTQKDKTGKPTETPIQVLDRVCGLMDDAAVLTPDEKKTISEAIYELELVPSSPILMNAGTGLGQLSACFVLPVGDSMEEIYDTLKSSALVHKSGGGTGFSFNNLRGTGSSVRSTGGIASGPLSFMQVFNASTNTIKQGGKRRGANMGVINVDHLNIEEFITCKQDLTQFTNFNISIGITEKFRYALSGKGVHTQEQLDILQAYNMTSSEIGYIYWLTSGACDGQWEFRDARKIWDLIVKCAWTTGEPGLFFLDTVNACATTIEKIESPNPCGEIPLLPNEACNLAAINLTKCVTVEDGIVSFDPNKLKQLTRAGVQFLNVVIDQNKLPLPQITEQVRKYRKEGLGIMGFGDLCYMLGVAYGDLASRQLAAQIMSTMAVASYEVSNEMYNRYSEYDRLNKTELLAGFADCWRQQDMVKVNAFYAGLKTASLMYDWNSIGDSTTRAALHSMTTSTAPQLNYTRLTVAPTGTTGILANVSGGMEPNFALVYYRLVNGTDRHCVLNPFFLEAVEREREQGGLTNVTNEQIIQDLLELGSIQKCSWATEEMKRVFVCAADLDWKTHLDMFYEFQRFVDNSVSKTVNMPNSATIDDVYLAYHTAMYKGLKGITIYRDGSRASQVLTAGSAETSDIKFEASYGYEWIKLYKDLMQKRGLVTRKARIKAYVNLTQFFHFPTDYPEAIDDNFCKYVQNPAVQQALEAISPEGFITDIVALQRTLRFVSQGESLHVGIRSNVADTQAREIKPRDRAKTLNGSTTCVKTGCGKLYVTINHDKDGICEVFTSTGKGGGCPSQSEASARLISVALRAGIQVEEIVSQLKSIRCPSAIRNPSSECMSCPDAIARLVQDQYNNLITGRDLTTPVEEPQDVSEQINGHSRISCPECSATLQLNGGCYTCLECGWSKCN